MYWLMAVHHTTQRSSQPQIVRWQSGLTLSIHKVWECGMYGTYTRGLTGSNPVMATSSPKYKGPKIEITDIG
jgi:hypothetical protein